MMSLRSSAAKASSSRSQSVGPVVWNLGGNAVVAYAAAVSGLRTVYFAMLTFAVCAHGLFDPLVEEQSAVYRLVLGHGPHVVRPLEIYHDRLVAYSLGNFATYYGISVEGIRGIAPILLVTLDDQGSFVAGRIEATTQVRPSGPSLDPSKGVIRLLQTLTMAAFPVACA